MRCSQSVVSIQTLQDTSFKKVIDTSIREWWKKVLVNRIPGCMTSGNVKIRDMRSSNDIVVRDIVVRSRETRCYEQM